MLTFLLRAYYMSEQQMRKGKLQLVYTMLYLDAIKMQIEDSRISNIYSNIRKIQQLKEIGLTERAEKPLQMYNLRLRVVLNRT